ncbi:hypothetical protein [Muricoccus roseus]|uniref:hypothetical protein n=1 Tax=Muricoccus roseus TaxID=198092 RepID=UPI00093373EE|nr:hypothetical protein [Roseomonas rosea]
MTEAAYAGFVAPAQFLPGPASSQVGFSIGALRGGLPGGHAGLARLHHAFGAGDAAGGLRRRSRGRRHRGRDRARVQAGGRGGGGAGGSGHGGATSAPIARGRAWPC